MRPAAFQSRRVASCVCTSERLCTCIRSRRWTRSFRMESSICRMPACLPLVHTLVATKSFDWTPNSAASWPVTASADPYMGELSMTRAPTSTRTLSASLASAMPRASPPTSKACQVPRPTAGSSSPDRGMRRSRKLIALEPFGISIPPRATAEMVMNARRDSVPLSVFPISRSCQRDADGSNREPEIVPAPEGEVAGDGEKRKRSRHFPGERNASEIGDIAAQQEADRAAGRGHRAAERQHGRSCLRLDLLVEPRLRQRLPRALEGVHEKEEYECLIGPVGEKPCTQERQAGAHGEATQEARACGRHHEYPRGRFRTKHAPEPQHTEDPADDPHAGAVAVLEEQRPLDPVGRHGAESYGLGEAQKAGGANAEALPEARADLGAHRRSHRAVTERGRITRPLMQERAGQGAQEKAGRAEKPWPRDVNAAYVCSYQRGGHEAEARELGDAREEAVLGALEAGLVEGVDAPRVDGAIAEGGADRVDRLRDQEEHIGVRDEVEAEGEAAQDAAHHEAPAPAERVGEGAGRYVGEEGDGEVHGEHAVDLELIEATRAQEERIHAAQESARQRVGEPDTVVAAHDAGRGELRGGPFHGLAILRHAQGMRQGRGDRPWGGTTLQSIPWGMIAMDLTATTVT